MPAVNKDRNSIPAPRRDSLQPAGSARGKVIPFATESVNLPGRHSEAVDPFAKQPDSAMALLLTAALHLAGLALWPSERSRERLTPPTPIQVAWIAAPAAKKAESKPLPAPERPKPTQKPKTVNRPTARPKAVLSSRAPAEVAAEVRKTRQTKSAAAEMYPVETAPVKTAAAAKPFAPAAMPNGAENAPLVLPSLNADYLDNPAPVYPDEARERGEQGKVLVRARVDADGSVAELALKSSSGFRELDRSALDTVKKWRFVPARRGEEAVSAWVVVPITFSLEG